MNYRLKSKTHGTRRQKVVVPVKAAAARIRSERHSSPTPWPLFRDVLFEIFLLVVSDGIWLYETCSSFIDNFEDEFESEMDT